MATKDYDFITYDERLFRLQFETSIENLDRNDQFEHGIQTIRTVIDAFDTLLSPTNLECVISNVTDGTSQTEMICDETALSTTEISDSIRETAETISTPHFARVTFTGCVRITLSDGIHYVGGDDDLSAAEKRIPESSGISTPLEISIRQHDVMMPGQTEIITITGHSDHWLDGDTEKFYLPEATPLAKLDQSRLAAALSSLYDTVEPVEIVFDTFENTEGWHTPKQTVPAYQSLETRHAVEWVLENFEQRQPDQQSFELEYAGDEIHPLITHTQGRSPDEKVHVFLRTAIPDDRYGDDATVTVHYPTDTAVFVNESGNRWVLETESDL